MSKPDGVWDVIGARYLLGDGSKTPATVLIDAIAGRGAWL